MIAMETKPAVDEEFLRQCLLEMLAIPSPTGFTDELVRYVCRKLDDIGVDYSLSRRGTIHATLPGRDSTRARAVANHLDTIGATVATIHDNGRLGLKPVGTWSSRFAEGGRVTVFADHRAYRGQVLPLLASGHAFNEMIDRLPIGWDQVEVRVNQSLASAKDARALGIDEGDFVAFDADPEWDESGYITARHLDNKAGAAAALSALKQESLILVATELELPDSDRTFEDLASCFDGARSVAARRARRHYERGSEQDGRPLQDPNPTKEGERERNPPESTRKRRKP